MSNNWKRKLAAYLHDPPSKALDIRTHGERSDAAFRQAGFVDTEIGDYFSHADHTGAAADRLPFPQSQSSSLRCSFDGVRNAFLHPLGGPQGRPQKLSFYAEFKTVEQGIEGEGAVQPALTMDSLKRLKDEDERWRARFFAHWRLWEKYATEKDYRLALLPADTRIPDHSIWTHMQVTSALAGCVGSDMRWQPAFLKFQVGPVQEFIAQARSIRDLWSGSYLLSWLMAAGLKALSAEAGPDAVIFPNLRGQPLFDLHWREELWRRVKIGDGPVWDSLANDVLFKSNLLTPNLPNVFLAVVPADRATALGKLVEDTIRQEWSRIAGAVWMECEKAGLTDGEGELTALKRKARFDAQIARFLSISWQATPWPETLEEALKLADGFGAEMPIRRARNRVKAVVDMATQQMPKEHRDWRYYDGGKDGPMDKLNNIGLGWSVILAFNGWALDAVRQTRQFAAASAGGWETGVFNNKDVLTGREEAVAGGRVWVERAGDYAQAEGGPWKSLFKHNDWLGATTLVKRLWHIAYLGKEPWSLKVASDKFPMPNTRSLAAHDPFGRDDDPKNDEAQDTDSSEKYFAVLALDGDEIGRWVSGEKAPSFASQLAEYSDGSKVQRLGAKPYFEGAEFEDFLKAKRPLSPSYHLQFSEALSNFALRCARPIVEAFHGRLIYAGGDDVVALLPADTALECAKALRMAFTGREVTAKGEKKLFHSPQPGFLSSDEWKDNHSRGQPIPFLVPGPAADCSVGIAIAHFKSPLQDVVRAAWDAEKRAKNHHGRSAVAVTLMKGSGETIEWGCNWDSGGLELYRAIGEALREEKLSAKFPYRLAELLGAYVTGTTPLVKSAMTLRPVEDFKVDEVIRLEFEHVLGRQRGRNFQEKDGKNLVGALKHYLEKLGEKKPDLERTGVRSRNGEEKNLIEKILNDVIGLCQTVAFANRTAGEDSSSNINTLSGVSPSQSELQRA